METIMSIETLITLLTEEQLKKAKEGKIVWLSNAAQRKLIVLAGFDVVIKDRRNSHLEYSLSKSLSSFLNSHGVAVKVVRIEDRYCPDYGAFEVVFCQDANGKEFSIGNKYDSSMCFRISSEDQILNYVNKQ